MNLKYPRSITQLEFSKNSFSIALVLMAVVTQLGCTQNNSQLEQNPHYPIPDVEVSPSPIPSPPPILYKEPLKRGILSLEAVTQIIRDNPDQPQVSKDLLMGNPQVIPITAIIIDNQPFYFSAIYNSEQRSHVVMYTEIEGRFVPRLLYKSQSDGGWKSVPYVYPTLVYSKGQGIHYTQETKLHFGIIQTLEKIKKITIDNDTASHLLRHFTLENLQKNNVYTFDSESRIHPDSGLLNKFQECTPGKCFKCNPANDYTSVPDGIDELYKLHIAACREITLRETFQRPLNQGRYDNFTQYIENINNELTKPELAGFLPDFSSPQRQYQFQHTLLGEATVKVYRGELNHNPIEWHMARDQVGRVWIDRIRATDNNINSYGTDRVVIDSGLLTNKPLEYTVQAFELKIKNPTERILVPHLEWPQRYSDITPVLKHLLPIQNFIAAESALY